MHAADRIALFLAMVAVGAFGNAAFSQQDVAQQPRARSLATPITPFNVGDTCGAATPKLGPLPFATNDDTTGDTDDYNLAAAGNCAGGGVQLAGTGSGSDLVYAIQTNITCELDVFMLPTDTILQGSDNMALYIVTDCAQLAGSCVGVDDSGGGGSPEAVTFTAVAGMTYYAIVDGNSGDAGPLDFFVQENAGAPNGCTLVPVELQTFTVE